VTPLADAEDASRFGGKAASLARALRSGLPVPPGFAIAFDAAADATPVLDWGPLAVRSSAVGEDGASASFAGQHATVLGVPAGGLQDAVDRVRASTVSASGYRARLGLPSSTRMGVVVQAMVDAAVAGVLFSRDPLTGEPVCCVEAAWGLGEAVVQGLVTPDGWRLDDKGRVLEERRGVKDVAVRLSGRGTETVPVDDPDAPCLDAGALVALRALARDCEHVWSRALDLEWAFDRTGRLWLLQARPVTR
jgi:pyruvate,water dikinase